ncbi:MAG: hypothetical protein KC486_16800 [Myxococcales bacterium]|nr:hypothetical protein [Myxococcales bacterium]
MSRLRRTLLASLLLAACADDVGDAGSETQTTAATTATTTASTTGGGTATTGDGTSGSETSSGSSASGAATTDATSTSSDTTDDTTSTTGFTPTVGDGVFLYTGAGGDNYDTDAAAVEALYAGAGVKVTRSETIAGDITADHGCLVLLNPSQALPAAVGDAAQALLDGGGRVVFQTEHSGYGGHDVANALLADLGATIRSVEESESGWPELTLTPAPPLTDGVSELAPFYVARVDLGAGGAPIATIQGSDWVVIGRESVGHGEVVIVGDGSMFGYSLDDADNRAFILNFAER